MFPEPCLNLNLKKNLKRNLKRRRKKVTLAIKDLKKSKKRKKRLAMVDPQTKEEIRLTQILRKNLMIRMKTTIQLESNLSSPYS